MFAMHVQVAFVTKFRHRVFTVRHLERMKEIFASVCDESGAHLIKFNGEDNHVHLLVEHPPKIAVSNLVNSLKGVWSRLLCRELPELDRHYSRARRLWSASYLAGSVGGAPLSIVRQYVESQRRPV